MSAGSGEADNLIVWDASDSFRKVAVLKGHIDDVLTCAWSPDGSSIASGDTAGNVLVWKTNGRRTFFKYTGHTGPVNAVAWSPDGKRIASASADSTVQVWQPS